MNDDAVADEGVVTALLQGIRRHRADLEDAGVRSETLRMLPPDAVEILRELGVFWLKTPRSLGGTPLSPLHFCDVIEELGYIDASAAWAAMIGAGTTGMAGGWLPDAGIPAVFVPGQAPPVLAGQPQPRGTGTRVPGGYRVSGRWSFASGIMHATWLIGAFTPDDDDERVVVFVAPKEDVRVIDTWHVAGLQGTGSQDFAVEDCFVPEERTYDRGAGPRRGGDLFRQDPHVFVGNEVPPLCIGLARRAIDDMTELASHTARFAGAKTLSERAVFLKELGRAEAKVRAGRLLHRDAIQAAWEAAESGEPTEEVAAAVGVASVYAVEQCAEVVSDLFRYGGGRVLALSHPMQRHLRNVLAARQHLSLTEEHYEIAGRERIQSWKSRED